MNITERLAADFAKIGMMAAEASQVLRAFADAARNAPMPLAQDVARLRLGMLRQQYGAFRVFLPRWWRLKTKFGGLSPTVSGDRS